MALTFSINPGISRLLATTALVATLATGLALLSPRIGVTHDVAKVIAEAWAVSVLLATGFAAPAQGERRLGWFLGLAALYGVLFSLDVVGLTPALLWFVSLAVLTTGGLVGGYIGSLLEYPGMLMVVAYVAAFADCFSFFHPNGLTANVLTNPKALALLTVPFPILGTEYVASLVGIGDVTFVALFVAGTRATGLSVARTAIALALAMLSVAVLVELGGAPLPALPFLGGAVVLAHPEARRLPREQTRRIALNLAVVTLVLGGLLLSAALARKSHAQSTASPSSSMSSPLGVNGRESCARFRYALTQREGEGSEHAIAGTSLVDDDGGTLCSRLWRRARQGAVGQRARSRGRWPGSTPQSARHHD